MFSVLFLCLALIVFIVISLKQFYFEFDVKCNGVLMNVCVLFKNVIVILK